MKRYLVLGIFSLSLILTGLVGAAQGPRQWELLGRREVDFTNDRDRIEVGRREGSFRQLQIRVQGGPIELHDMVVTFNNDQTFSPKLSQRFSEKSGSRVIDLPGDRRNIKHVDFAYRSINRRAGKATIALYAR
jgi:hypothetical protein